ncbi:MAG: prolyl oligopeptidase family serine peptidase, partial [Planctomycetota bacterium]
YGKEFVNLANRQWSKTMHNDLLDALKWAKQEGHYDGKRQAIYGGSYGGYAALVGATFTPDVFTCAISIVGPSNLTTLIRSVPEYWKPLRAIFDKRVGNIDTEEDFLKSCSPLFKVDQIRIPILIVQGKNDPRVKQQESEQIVTAMQKAGKAVEYILYENEGHGLAHPENRLDFYGKAEKFLERWLGRA